MVYAIGAITCIGIVLGMGIGGYFWIVFKKLIFCFFICKEPRVVALCKNFFIIFNSII